MTTQHTPGPWKTKPSKTPWQAAWADPENVGTTKRITSLYQDNQTAIMADGQTEAVAFVPEWGYQSDARLIAAAPDLLGAAEQVIASWESGDLAAAVRQLQDAVNKAKSTE